MRRAWPCGVLLNLVEWKRIRWGWRWCGGRNRLPADTTNILVVTRILTYAGWAIGGIGLILSGSVRVVGGIAIIIGGMLLMAAAARDVAGEWHFSGNPRILNALLAVVAMCWMALGLSVLL